MSGDKQWILPIAVSMLLLIWIIIYSEISRKPLSRLIISVFDPEREITTRINQHRPNKYFIPTSSTESSTESSAAPPPPTPIDARLDHDAHQVALQQWCQAEKWNYDAKTAKCRPPNKIVCENLPDVDGYSHHWVNDKCIKTLGNGGMCRSVIPTICLNNARLGRCQNECSNEFDPLEPLTTDQQTRCDECKLLPNVCDSECGPNYEDLMTETCRLCADRFGCKITVLPLVPADIVCDANGECIAAEDSYCTCALTKEYCSSKGLDWIEENHGQCTITKGQTIIENTIGATVTRKIKTNITTMINSCRSDPLSIDCVWGVAAVQTVGYEIVLDLLVKTYAEQIDIFRRDCIDTTVATGQQITKCFFSAKKLFNPAFLAGVTALELFGSLLSLIPGFPNVTQVVIQSILKYGGKAIDAVYKYGVKAGEVIWYHGDLAIDYLEKLSGRTLIVFDNAEEFLKDLNTNSKTKVGNGITTLLLSGVNFTQDGLTRITRDDIEETARTITLAVETGGAAMGTFVANVIESDGYSELEKSYDKIEKLFGQVGRLFTSRK